MSSTKAQERLLGDYMKNWESEFSPKTLNRGLEYAESGRVRIVNRSHDIIESVVMGRDEYNVSIKLKDDSIKSMFCTCPYFLREGDCKHLTATLYSLKDENDDIDEMISKADSGQIVEFLRKALKKNSGLANDFRTFVTGEIDSRYLEDKLCRSFASPYLVNKFIDEDLELLMNMGQYQLLFKFSRLIIEYSVEMSQEGYYNASDIIAHKIDDIAFDLIETREAKDFYKDILLNCDDFSICELFSDSYSKIADVDALFDD